MTSTLRLAAVDGVAIDPIIAQHSPRATALRVADSRKTIAKFNGDEARIERLMRSQPGPTALRFFAGLDRALARTSMRQPVARRPITAEVPHVIVHPSAKPTQPKLPLYDQAGDLVGRIPEAIQMPLEVLLGSYEQPGSIPAGTVLAAVAAIREYNTPIVIPPVVGEGNDPAGLTRPGGVA